MNPPCSNMGHRMEQLNLQTNLQIRDAESGDYESLNSLEQSCFSGDKISPRQIQHWLNAANKILLVVATTNTKTKANAKAETNLLGYGLVIMRKNSSVARLYSIAVSESARGQNVGKTLLAELENRVRQLKKEKMRLEVSVNNAAAKSLYTNIGYEPFAIKQHYYQDGTDALHMEKQLL